MYKLVRKLVSICVMVSMIIVGGATVFAQTTAAEEVNGEMLERPAVCPVSGYAVYERGNCVNDACIRNEIDTSCIMQRTMISPKSYYDENGEMLERPAICPAVEYGICGMENCVNDTCIRSEMYEHCDRVDGNAFLQRGRQRGRMCGRIS